MGAAVALLALLVVACGARSGPLDEETGGAGGAPVTTGVGSGSTGVDACQICEREVECGQCLVQAFDDTIRCPPAIRILLEDCWSLDEVHTDQYSFTYTCFYCPP
jgi:hypothetical protein